MIALTQPWWLLLVLLIPYWFWVRHRRSSSGQKIFLPETGRIQAVLSPKKIAYRMAPILLALSWIGMTIALSRPQRVLTHQEFTGEGIEIMMTMDVSPSMLSLDFEPNRLEASKKLAEEFISNRQGDKIGLTVFSGESYTKCPLTTDYQTLIKLLSELSPEYLEAGTAIGMGIATATNQLKATKSKSKIMILLTDGSNNRGSIEPLEAAKIAKTLGIKIYTIGIGSTGIVMMPFRRRLDGKFDFAPSPSEFDEHLLRKIAHLTDAKYFRAKSETELKEIYKEIDQLEKSKIEITNYQERIELFRPFLYSGMGLLLLYLILIFGWIKPLN